MLRSLYFVSGAAASRGAVIDLVVLIPASRSKDVLVARDMQHLCRSVRRCTVQRPCMDGLHLHDGNESDDEED